MEGLRRKGYLVDKPVGKGPEGNVYKAKRIADGVFCAIKEFYVRQLTEDEKENVIYEVRTLATVQNENVITYYDSFVHKGKIFVVMEYCDDPDLAKQIRARAEQQKSFTEGQIWSYFIQMLRGLVALHSKGVLYRNMRSGNVLQVDSKLVKLGEVGIKHLTTAGPVAIGNPHYVPPEVWENQSYTFKSDMWSLGCVLYEMAALAVPFGGCSLPDLRLKVIKGIYQPIPSSLYSAGLSTVLKLLLNPDQAARISSMDMLLHPILKAHLHHAPVPLLRVQPSEENLRLETISASLLVGGQPKILYPTVAITADRHAIQSQAFHLKQTASEPSGNLLQSGIAKEKPAYTSVRPKVSPILTPRAVLSSPDNDKMLYELSRPPSHGSKGKVPRVAMLGKKTPKTSDPSLSLPPLGLLATGPPRVNLKSFKTAYIQSTKIDSDEFPFEQMPVRLDKSDFMKEKSEYPLDAPGKTKPLVTSNKGTTPRKEKSSGSERSVASSSQSDDSFVRIRAPIDDAELSYSTVVAPMIESSLCLASSAASSQSDDLAIWIKSPVVDLDSASFTKAPANDLDLCNSKGLQPMRESSLHSPRSTTSSQSDDSTIWIKASVDGLESCKAKVVSLMRESAMHTSRPVGYTSSDDSVSLMRAPVDLSSAVNPNVTTPYNGDSAKSEQFSASCISNASALCSQQQIGSRHLVPADHPSSCPPNGSGGLNSCGAGLQEFGGSFSGIRAISITSPVTRTMDAGNALISIGVDDKFEQVPDDGLKVDHRVDGSLSTSPQLSNSLTTSTLECACDGPTAPITDQDQFPREVSSQATSSVVTLVGTHVIKKCSGISVNFSKCPDSSSLSVPRQNISARNRRLSLDVKTKEIVDKHEEAGALSNSNRMPRQARLATPGYTNPKKSTKSAVGNQMATGQPRNLASQMGTSHGSGPSQEPKKLLGNKQLSTEVDSLTVNTGMLKIKSDIAKVSVSSKKNSNYLLKSGAKICEETKSSIRSEANGKVAAQNPPNAFAQQSSSDHGMRKENSNISRSSSYPRKKHVVVPTKPIAPRENSGATTGLRRETATESDTPVSSNRASANHVSESMVCARLDDGIHPSQSQQKQIQARRISMDFSAKDKYVSQPSRSNVHVIESNAKAS